MAFLAKQRVFYYKKYKIDIWNVFKNTLQVTCDETFYNLKKSLKRQRKFRGAFKYTALICSKASSAVRKSKKAYKYKIDKTEKDKENIKDIQIKTRFLYALKNARLAKLLGYANLLKFLKYTVSQKFSTVLDPFIERDVIQQKIFYRRPFIYEARVPVMSKKKRKINEQFISFRLVKLFYVMYNYRQLKKIAKKAKMKSGVFEQNYLLIIECKLPSYLYRTSLLPTIFDSLQFVKTGNVWVNKEFKPLIFYNVKLFDIVGFRVLYKSYILWHFFKRLRRKAFAFMFSRCIYVSLQFWFTILISRFTLNDLVNSFSFDYYRIASYAQ